MANPFKIEQYRQGSFIIVEEKRNADHFFIILKGKVRIQRETETFEKEESKVLGPGDFFGVISAMSGHPRTETAIALTPVVVIVVYRDQFGLLIQKNAPVAMKIIRYFARELRSFDHIITKLTLKNSAEENPELLFNIGEYYFNKNQHKHAAYAYQVYLKYCPNGPNVSQAKMRLQAIGAPFTPPPVDHKSFHRYYEADQIIFCEHEPGRELFIIQRGQVKITKIIENDEVLLAVLEPGDIFGEMALLDGKPRSATAISAKQSQLMAINKENFEIMVHKQPQLATRLITLLSERIWMAYKQLKNLVLTDDLGRMYDMLLVLAEKNHAKIASKAVFQFDIGPKDLIKMVGIPDDKGEKLIMEMLQNRIVRVDGGKFICTDLLELEKTVHFYHKKSQMERKREKSSLEAR